MKNRIESADEILETTESTALEKLREDINQFRSKTPHHEKIETVLNQIAKDFDWKSGNIDAWEDVSTWIGYAKKMLEKDLEEKKQEKENQTSNTVVTLGSAEKKVEQDPKVMTLEEIHDIKRELMPIIKQFDQYRSQADGMYIETLQEVHKKNKQKARTKRSEKTSLDIPLDQLDNSQSKVSMEGRNDRKASYEFEFNGSSGDKLTLIPDRQGKVERVEISNSNRGVWQLLLPNVILNRGPKQYTSSARTQKNIEDVMRGWSGKDPVIRDETLSVDIPEFNAADPGQLGSAFAVSVYYIAQFIVQMRIDSRETWAVNYMTGVLRAEFKPENITLKINGKKADPNFTSQVLKAAQRETENQLHSTPFPIISNFIDRVGEVAKEWVSKLRPDVSDMKKPQALESVPTISVRS